MIFKKGQVVRNIISGRVFIVTEDQQEWLVPARYVIGNIKARLIPENLQLIGNNYKPRTTLRGPGYTARGALKRLGPMAGVPQRPDAPALPRHGPATDKLRELMNMMTQKDEQIRDLQKMYDDAHTELTVLRARLSAAKRKKAWWV